MAGRCFLFASGLQLSYHSQNEVYRLGLWLGPSDAGVSVGVAAVVDFADADVVAVAVVVVVGETRAAVVAGAEADPEEARV